MAAGLEGKLLYGKPAGYCSDSNSDDEEGSGNTGSSRNIVNGPQEQQQAVRNTGPKGVLDDYRYCNEQLEKEQRRKYEQIVAQAKYCILSGESGNDDLEIIRMKRLQETKDRLFAMGKIDELTKREEFLDYIESNHNCWIFIHIYDENNEGCITLNKIFNTLIGMYENLKLAKVLPSVVKMSAQFKENALPTLQVYRNEVLRGNFIRLTDQLGEQFTVDQLVHFLDRNGIDLRMSECLRNAKEDSSDEDY